MLHGLGFDCSFFVCNEVAFNVRMDVRTADKLGCIILLSLTFLHELHLRVAFVLGKHSQR
jgi:hypothetical protein